MTHGGLRIRYKVIAMSYIRVLWTTLAVLALLYAGIEAYLLVVTLLALRDWEPYQ